MLRKQAKLKCLLGYSVLAHTQMTFKIVTLIKDQTIIQNRVSTSAKGVLKK